MSGFSAYLEYTAIRLHFNSTYDYFKYSGKVPLTIEHYEKRTDKHIFEKLSRKYVNDTLKDYYVSNFLDNKLNVGWVGNIVGHEGEDSYARWSRIIQSITYIFKNDLDYLLDLYENPNKILIVESEDYPILLQEVMRKNIHIETFCILNKILKFKVLWDKKVKDDIIYPYYQKLMIKYTPLIPHDITKMKIILKDKLNDLQ